MRLGKPCCKKVVWLRLGWSQSVVLCFVLLYTTRSFGSFWMLNPRLSCSSLLQVNATGGRGGGGELKRGPAS